MTDVTSSGPPTTKHRPIKVVLDAMGGDHAPANEVLGALMVAQQLGSDVEIILVGKEEVIQPILSKQKAVTSIKVVNATDVIGMGDEPSTIVKSRRESSLYIGLDLLRTNQADAFVSAGNTGGVMATATLLCGRIPGVSRPTIGSFFPTKTGRPTLLLDVGANVDSKPKFLSDYSVMGSVYARLMLGIDSPTVGLLNVGEEEGKGTEVAREAHQLLRANGVNFVGNVEGRDILSGTVDIVVCDGFEGNIILKFAESILGFLKDRFRAYADRGIIQKLLIGAFRPVLKSALRDMDYQEYGGVPLLGIQGVAIIGHGSSSPLAIANMIQRAVEMVRKDVNGTIQKTLSSTPSSIKESV
ncbi:MAG: phosphate acyltransferase PlsX [Candidatus Kapabacteria bacterium]|nr:phosphate acyltransferase PlsX [Candidatus Kapabacteria bacterium]